MKYIIITTGIIAGICFLVFANNIKKKDNEDENYKNIIQDIQESEIQKIMQEEPSNHIFQDNFANKKILEEAGEMDKSKDDNWWLNSGAYFVIENGIGRTIRGSLSKDDKWRKKYGKAKPRDTEDGYSPQNIFRLITRSQWENLSQEIYVKITDTHKTDTKERDASDGVLLFGHYSDQNNLYYAGLRVDGQAVIKKKREGKYETLAIVPVYKGIYNKDSNINLLSQNKWIGLRMTLQNSGDTVKIVLSIDKDKTGEWEQILTAVDTGENCAVIKKGHTGIRTDFMDVEFRNYIIKEIL